MTKRIKKNHKGQLLCDLNDISHLASKNFLVLQAAPCLPWKGIEQGRQKEKLKTHEAHQCQTTCPMFMGRNPMHIHH